jgi:hypothetical protein
MTRSDGSLLSVAENVLTVTEGQGNPPELVTGMFWLVNTTEELSLLQGPETAVACPATTVQLTPRMVALNLMPAAGTFSVPVGPVADLQTCHGPFALFDVRVALKVDPLALTLHPVKTGLLINPQTGTPAPVELPGVVPLNDIPEQDIVTVPSLNDVLPADAVNGVFCGSNVSATATWLPSPNTVASAGIAR